MTSRTSCARLALMRSNSASGVMAACWELCLSVWRISSPMGVPPGSRSKRTSRPVPWMRSARSLICVDLPAPSVPSNVMKRPAISKSLQARTFGRVFNDPAFGFEFVAQSIRALEVFGFAGGLAVFEELCNFGWGFGFLFLANGENGIDFLPCGEIRGGLGRVDLAGCERTVHVADPIEDDGPTGRDVEVFVHGFGETLEE